MSEQDILKRFWISIASGIALLIISGIIASSYVARSTTERSVRNEESVKKLWEKKEDKNSDAGIHQMLLDGQIENQRKIEKQSEKGDQQFQFIIQRLDVVNQNILNLTK